MVMVVTTALLLKLLRPLVGGKRLVTHLRLITVYVTADADASVGAKKATVILEGKPGLLS